MAEIAAVEAWVATGGALLLIADHMPFPGAAADLAAFRQLVLNLMHWLSGLLDEEPPEPAVALPLG